MSEYYKRIKKKIVFWHIAYRYYGYGAPYCFSGFFSRLEAGTSNVVVYGPQGQAWRWEEQVENKER